VGLRAVVFDLFGTLVQGWGQQTATAKSTEIAELLGAPVGAFLQLMRETYTIRASGDLGDPAEMLERLCGMIGVRPDPAGLARAAEWRVTQFFEALREPRPEVRSLLAVLRDRSIRVGMISDCSAETPLLWERLVWPRPIQVPLFSWSEGIRKPAPRLYRRVCALLEVDAADCLYVGDGGSQELSGAERAGMQAVRIQRARADGESPLQYDPDPDWRGESISTLSAVLPRLGG
jgi:putative hydrolase of the HAD superfamily